MKIFKTLAVSISAIVCAGSLTSCASHPKAMAPAPAPAAAASAPAPAPVPPPGAPLTKEQRLQELLAQYEANTITPGDYHRQRAAIVAEP